MRMRVRVNTKVKQGRSLTKNDVVDLIGAWAGTHAGTTLSAIGSTFAGNVISPIEFPHVPANHRPRALQTRDPTYIQLQHG